MSKEINNPNECAKDLLKEVYNVWSDVSVEDGQEFRSPKTRREIRISRGRYSFLFEYKTNDYKKWAYGLKKAGYATNPKYPQLLIKIIEKYNLDKYDKNYKKKSGNKKTTDKKSVKTDKFIAISIADFKQVKSWPSGRKIYKNNGANLLLLKKGTRLMDLLMNLKFIVGNSKTITN